MIHRLFLRKTVETIMRRQDRKVTDIDEIKGILNGTRIIHLGMMDGDYPYLGTLHFGYAIYR